MPPAPPAFFFGSSFAVGRNSEAYCAALADRRISLLLIRPDS
jgi:hypothetical protein